MNWTQQISAELKAIHDAPTVDVAAESGDLGAEKNASTAFMSAAGSNSCEGMPVTYAEVYLQIYGPYRGEVPADSTVARAWAGITRNLMATMTAGWRRTHPLHAEDWMRRLLRHHRIAFSSCPHATPGKWKDTNVWIHTRAGELLETPPPEEVESLLAMGFTYAQTAPTLWRRSTMLEFLVVRIHPFRDGNGRVSRIVGNEWTPRLRIATEPYFQEYINGLRSIEEDLHAAPWLRTLATFHRHGADMGQRPLPRTIETWSDRGWIVDEWHSENYRPPLLRERQGNTQRSHATR